MRTSDFDYNLPEELIAQTPAIPRDSCRLLCLDCCKDAENGAIEHRAFHEIRRYLRPGDLLVVNNTRVLPARLHGAKADTKGAVEALLLKDVGQGAWGCLVKPAKRIKVGQKILFGNDGELSGTVLEAGEMGQRTILFESEEMSVMDAFHCVGETPLPPYITKRCDDPEMYQTVFSRDEHSAAAPTAGLHFTPELFDELAAMGVDATEVELQVGLDTFRTVEAEDPRDHQIHTERFSVSRAAADKINETRKAGGRIVAVGTTSVRTLESAFDAKRGCVVAQQGDTSLFLLPGSTFNVVDAMITNFHVPRSSLMMLVSAFAGRERIFDAYDEAIRERYRMLSFGDAMFIYRSDE